MIERVCAKCGRIGCTEHKRKPWQGSSRRAKTISGSAQQKRAAFILLRDQGLCHVCGGAGADQADHVISLGEGGADHISNMAAIHGKPCHVEKTSDEARRGRMGYSRT